MATAGGALATTPLDLLLARWEAPRYLRAKPPKLPLIFVTGAPRSGTTLVAETLAAHLEVVGFNNLTQLFPHAPITANLIFGRLLSHRTPDYKAYYGRTSGLDSHNDGLHIWDRWWPGSRYEAPTAFDETGAENMRRFFGAYEEAFGKPFLSKNNALCTGIEAVAAVLPTARFLCVQREAAYNAQSIIVARETIQGSRQHPYGVGAPDAWKAQGPFEEVCAQVLFHQRRALEQQQRLGKDRVWIVQYEEFCKDPGGLVGRVAEDILDRHAESSSALTGFRVSRRKTLAIGEFQELLDAIDQFSDSRGA